jgi:hypothetical protein
VANEPRGNNRQHSYIYMKKNLKKAAAPPGPLSQPDEDAELETLPRHIEFLRSYLGRPHDSFSTLKQYTTIGLTADTRRRTVSSHSTFHRFATLSVEGDRCFDMLEAQGRPDHAPKTPYEWIKHRSQRRATEACSELPNATMHCLHYGNGTQAFPTMSYRVILALDNIVPGDVVRVCPLSVVRCDDEIRFYAQYATTVDAPVSTRDVSRYWAQSPVALWPNDLPYYHGIGARHVAKDALVSFPSNLLRLHPCPSLGDGQLQVVAAEYLHEGTCFLYGGTVRERYVRQAKRPRDPTLRATHTTLPQSPDHSTIIPLDAVYSVELSSVRTCIGQNITRFINHRFHMSGFGNVVLKDVMIPVARDDEDIALNEGAARAAPAGSAVIVKTDRNTLFLNIPFMMTKTCVHKGTQLTTTSYGLDYDAKLERIAMTNHNWVPFSCTARIGVKSRPLPGLSPAYTGTYLANLDVGSFVWRPSVGHKTTPWLDLYVIEMLRPSSLLLRSLVTRDEIVKSATTAEGNDFISIPLLTPQQQGYVQRPRFICSRQEVALLIEEVDFELSTTGGSNKAMKLWFSWVVESTICVYEHMEDNAHWFGPLIPFDEVPL